MFRWVMALLLVGWRYLQELRCLFSKDRIGGPDIACWCLRNGLGWADYQKHEVQLSEAVTPLNLTGSRVAVLGPLSDSIHVQYPGCLHQSQGGNLWNLLSPPFLQKE